LTRATAKIALFLIGAPLLAGCGARNAGRRADETPMQTQQRPGLTTKQKVVALAGAAALYYVYKTYTAQKAAAPQQVRNAVPPGAQLYRSRATGGIYWREPNNPQRVHWLTLPNNRIQVPQSDYDRVMAESDQWRNIPVHQAGDPGPSPGAL
jgi:hypothetical protein